jgi:mxaD protein
MGRLGAPSFDSAWPAAPLSFSAAAGLPAARSARAVSSGTIRPAVRLHRSQTNSRRPRKRSKREVKAQQETFMTALFARRIAVALGVALCATSAIAANVISVKEKVELSVPPEKAWDMIKDFDGWQNWHPAVASTDITSGKGNTRGTVRVLNLKDGGKVTEQLTHYQPKNFSYSYKITDSPLPVTDYVSTISVKPSKSGSVVIWTSHFKAKEGTPDADASKTIRGIYTAGLNNLKEKLK